MTAGTILKNWPYLKVAERVDLKSSHHNKIKFATMWDDGC